MHSMVGAKRKRDQLAQKRSIGEQLCMMRSQVRVISSSSLRQHPTDPSPGRISSAGFIPKHLGFASTRDTTSTSTVAVSPEAVLFRQKNAPTRYAESDLYFANERELKTELPDSDLLKALHTYTSDFYARATGEDNAGDWRSMDESALIAMGILMEEATREALGETGDMVFTEGQEEVEASNKSNIRSASSERRHKGQPSKRRRLDRSGD